MDRVFVDSNPRIKQLVLDNLTSSRSSDFIDILGSCPSLETLTLDDVVLDWSQPITSQPLVIQSLRKMIFNGLIDDFNWFLSAVDAPNLENLYIDIPNFFQLPADMNAIQRVRKGLSHCKRLALSTLSISIAIDSLCLSCSVVII